MESTTSQKYIDSLELILELFLFWKINNNKLVITKGKGVCSMILIPGSLSVGKLVMMLSNPAKSAGDARYASQSH